MQLLTPEILLSIHYAKSYGNIQINAKVWFPIPILADLWNKSINQSAQAKSVQERHLLMQNTINTKISKKNYTTKVEKD